MRRPSPFLSATGWRQRIWTLHQQATTWGRPPSEGLALRPRWLAWQFDQIVWADGGWLDAQLRERDPRGRPLRTVGQVFGTPDGASLVGLMRAAGLVEGQF